LCWYLLSRPGLPGLSSVIGWHTNKLHGLCSILISFIWLINLLNRVLTAFWVTVKKNTKYRTERHKIMVFHGISLKSSNYTKRRLNYMLSHPSNHVNLLGWSLVIVVVSWFTSILVVKWFYWFTRSLCILLFNVCNFWSVIDVIVVIVVVVVVVNGLEICVMFHYTINHVIVIMYFCCTLSNEHCTIWCLMFIWVRE